METSAYAGVKQGHRGQGSLWEELREDCRESSGRRWGGPGPGQATTVKGLGGTLCKSRAGSLQVLGGGSGRRETKPFGRGDCQGGTEDITVNNIVDALED